MHEKSFLFQLGNFECLAVRDTIDPMRVELNFPTIPISDILTLASQYDISLKRLLEITSLLIKTGKNTVIIDTGMLVGLRPNARMLIPNLQDARISCRDIDTRNQIVELALNTKARVFGSHLPFPNIGNIFKLIFGVRWKSDWFSISVASELRYLTIFS